MLFSEILMSLLMTLHSLSILTIIAKLINVEFYSTALELILKLILIVSACGYILFKQNMENAQNKNI